MDSDRHVRDWMQSGQFHGVIGAGAMTIFVVAALIGGFPVPLRDHPLALFAIALPLGYVAGSGIGRAVLGGSGAAAQQVYMPGARGTYVVQHSHIDAMEARGDYAGAVDAWERLAIAEPANPWPLIRAGELYLRTLHDPALALERFRGARAIPGVAREPEMYATQKVIDLLLGPLADRGRALVELRRLADRYPGTREAAHAREALARLKAEQRGEHP